MKALALIIATSLGVATAALAQQTSVRGEASAESQTSVSANRNGANVASDNRAQGGVAVERDRKDGTREQAATGFSGASEMNATLERSVDTRRAKVGDEVTAKTNETFTTASGATIPRGSRLVGRVTEARARERGEAAAASQLGIVFERAELPDGRVVPMQATIQAVAAARSQAQGELGSASHGTDAFGSSHASGGGLAGGGLTGGAIGGVGAASGHVVGSAAGGAGGAVRGATRLPRSDVGAASNGAVGATAGGALLGSSAGAVGGLNASGRWLAGSRGVFGIGDLELASAAAGGAQGSLITSPSRNVRLDGGTQLLLVGSAASR
ncbi:MAG TPA: hypothetical protein VFL84_14135 [Gammaproteobacteria bacterium]|nr:hypothetical protein [Gammaproteobacteria bacterium]